MNNEFDDVVDCPNCGWNRFILTDKGLFCPKCRVILTVVDKGVINHGS